MRTDAHPPTARIDPQAPPQDRDPPPAAGTVAPARRRAASVDAPAPDGLAACPVRRRFSAVVASRRWASFGAEVLSSLRLGLFVLFSELRWSLFRALRRMEIRQIKKRLDQELRRLSGLAADADRPGGRPGDAQTELALRQVAFLRQEAAWLEGELDAARRRFLDARRRHSSL